MARLSQMFDVLNNVTVDAIIAPYFVSILKPPIVMLEASVLTFRKNVFELKTGSCQIDSS